MRFCSFISTIFTHSASFGIMSLSPASCSLFSYTLSNMLLIPPSDFFSFQISYFSFKISIWLILEVPNSLSLIMFFPLIYFNIFITTALKSFLAVLIFFQWFLDSCIDWEKFSSLWVTHSCFFVYNFRLYTNHYGESIAGLEWKFFHGRKSTYLTISLTFLKVILNFVRHVVFTSGLVEP